MTCIIFRLTNQIGDFENDVRHGKGKIVYRNKDEYLGEWCNDHMDGKGTYTWNDDKRVYTGHW